VKDEMGNTLWFYAKKMNEWSERAKSSEGDGLPGHASYAWQQAEMWKKLQVEAEKMFEDNAV
jgi:hypothetical protein